MNISFGVLIGDETVEIASVQYNEDGTRELVIPDEPNDENQNEI